MTVPVPRVRVSKTFTFTYVRPRAGGWPLIHIESMFDPAGSDLAPMRITVAVISKPEGDRILAVSTLGTWAKTGQQAKQYLDMPGRKRYHSTMAPGWVLEITEDALARARKLA